MAVMPSSRRRVMPPRSSTNSEQPVKGDGAFTGKKESVLLESGDMVYTAPMMAHSMRFIEDSVFLALATESRGQSAYEEDTVRVKLI